MKAWFGLAGIGVAALGLGGYFLVRPTELPEPHRGDQREVFPDLDFHAAVPGSKLDRIYGTFGMGSEAGKNAATRRCVYFVYDPDLFEGSLVVLTNGTLVEKRWIVRGSTKPEDCSALLEERLDLRGWYAAAVR